MICAVCLNPCIDRTVEIDKFTYAGMNRIQSSREDGCGKGVNVALVSKALWMESSCIGYLFNDNGALIADRLKAAGVVTQSAIKEKKDNRFEGITFVLTGTLPTLTRSEAEEIIVSHGGKTSSSVSKKTGIVLAGTEAGSKLTKAEQLGIKIIDENEFRAMLED